MTSGEDPTSHNIPVGEDATPAAKRDQPRWLKSRFPGRSSEGERLEFLSFDEGCWKEMGLLMKLWILRMTRVRLF